MPPDPDRERTNAGPSGELTSSERRQRAAQLREAVRNGRYRPPVDGVAEALVGWFFRLRLGPVRSNLGGL